MGDVDMDPKDNSPEGPRPVAGTKRPRSDTAANEAEAKRVRALTRRADNAHKAIELYYGDKATSVSTTISAVHLAIRSLEPVLGFTVAPIPRFEFKPRAMLTSWLLAYNSARHAWSAAAAVSESKPEASKSMLAVPLGWTHKKEELADMAGLVMRATETILQIKGVKVTPPQATTDISSVYPRLHGPPHAFFVQNLSVESVRDASAGHAFCLRAIDGSTFGLSFHEWNPAPKSHLRTLKGMETVADASKARVAELTNYLTAHVTKRRPQIDYVATAFAAHHWGTEMPKDWFELLLASLEVDILIDEADGKRKRAVHVNVYALGLFTEHDACEKWSQAVLGDAVDFGIYGFGTPLKKPFSCAYCHEGDHHLRLCRLRNHPLWFHHPDVKAEHADADDDDGEWKKPKSKSKPAVKGGVGKGKGKPRK